MRYRAMVRIWLSKCLLDKMRDISIVLAEDHNVIRQGLKALLDANPGFAVVGEASDGLEAAEVVEKLQPDVLLLDVVMPGLNGLEVTRRVTESSPNTRVVILSMYDNQAYVHEALRAGAMAYILKGSMSDELVRGITEAAAGRHYLSPPLSELVIDAYVQKLEGDDLPLDLYETLTAREREVLHLIAEGHTSAEIGDRLCISKRTAEIHRSKVMHKLGLRTRTDLVRYALRRGILPPEN